MEAAELDTSLVVASAFAYLLKYPNSPVYQTIPSEDLRRFLLLSRYTGLFAGCLLALYIISIEFSLSGVGMNPARSFASAFAAQNWIAFPLYIFTPVLGMFSAAERYQFLLGRQAIECAKLNHHTYRRCIFPPATTGEVSTVALLI